MLAVVIAGFSPGIGNAHETHLSAVDHQTQAHAWISGAHENPRRPRCRASPSRQRAHAPGRLIRGGKQINSFTRAHRLSGPHAFAAVFAHKCWVNGRLFQVYAKPNGVVQARLGVVVNKRVMPRAVARNYCKRMAREVSRAERNALAGVDLVVRARTSLTRAESARARAELCDLLHRAQRQCADRDMTPLR